MFRKSRRKIVATIMSILVLLWVGTIGIIYASSYLEKSKQNQEMLKAHADMYVLNQDAQEGQNVQGTEGAQEAQIGQGTEDSQDAQNGQGAEGTQGAQDAQGVQGLAEGTPPDDSGRKDNRDFDPQSPTFQLSTFYTVAISDDGEVLEIKNDQQTVLSDDELTELAQSVVKDGKQDGEQYGADDNLAYYITDKGEYTLVTFMDNTLVNESTMTLIRYTLIYGCVALVLFFFLSVYLSKKIVNPLEESYQKQKQFISDAGHELKTPVSVVSANAELLSREVGENKWLANIQYENERMGVLIGQLLDLARTENVTPQMERVDFSRLVAGEVLPFESVAFEKGLKLTSNIADGIVVDGCSSQLRQVVSILLDNAICHSKAPGDVSGDAQGNALGSASGDVQGGALGSVQAAVPAEVVLNLSKEHKFARLSVINSGDEIPKEQRDQLFERFYRVDSARSDGGDGKHYGLGLAIAKAIATYHKAHLEVQCYDGLVEFIMKIPMV